MNDSAENPNRKRSFYLANIIFLCSLTILSLVFAMIVYFRLRTKGTDGVRRFYSESQIEQIRENASEETRKEVLLKVQSSLASGESTMQMLRDLFEDRIVVVSGGRYYFFPLLEKVEKNDFEPENLHNKNGIVEYSGENSSVQLRQGILLSDNNGRIDWERLADSGIDECTVSVGRIEENRFVRDGQLDRNCSMAVQKGIRVGLSIEVKDPADEDILLQAADTAKEVMDQYGVRRTPEQKPLSAIRTDSRDQTSAESVEEKESSSEGEETVPEGAIDPGILLRILSEEESSEEETGGDKWTTAVRQLCRIIEAQEEIPVIGADLRTFAAQLDLAALADYDRWLIDHEETAYCPYSFSAWEYSTEGFKEGVPGKSILYVRVKE